MCGHVCFSADTTTQLIYESTSHSTRNMWGIPRVVEQKINVTSRETQSTATQGPKAFLAFCDVEFLAQMDLTVWEKSVQSHGSNWHLGALPVYLHVKLALNIDTNQARWTLFNLSGSFGGNCDI